MPPIQTLHLFAKGTCRDCEERKLRDLVEEKLCRIESTLFEIQVDIIPRWPRTLCYIQDVCKVCDARQLINSVQTTRNDVKALLLDISTRFLPHCKATSQKFSDAESNGLAVGVTCSLQYMCLHAKYLYETHQTQSTSRMSL